MKGEPMEQKLVKIITRNADHEEIIHVVGTAHHTIGPEMPLVWHQVMQFWNTHHVFPTEQVIDGTIHPVDVDAWEQARQDAVES